MKKVKVEKDYYKEIDEALKSYENYKPYHTKSMDWVANRIDWCYKFHHITKEQMEELADRSTEIFERVWR